MLTLIVGIVLGFVTCLYLIVVQQNKGNKNPSAALSGSSLYCNFIILDKSEAVKNAVEEKLQNKIGKGFLRDKLINQVSQTASEKVSDEKIGEKILEKIIQEIPVKIHELGITAEATKVYCRESIFILKLQLLSVDMQKLITKKAGEEKANKVEEMFKLLGGQVAKDTVGSKLLPKICSKIQEKLPEILKEKFSEKGLVMDVEVKTEAEEAAYFFGLLEA